VIDRHAVTLVMSLELLECMKRVCIIYACMFVCRCIDDHEQVEEIQSDKFLLIKCTHYLR